jgi:lysophospholipase L1-like esterase
MSPDRSPETSAPHRRRRWAGRLALAATSLLLTLAAAEGLIRLAGLAPEVGLVEHGRYRLSPDPLLGFEPIPRQTFARDPAGHFDYAGRSNSLGFRDREHAVAKPPGVYRIVVLGDSVGAGLKVARTEDTFAPLLEGLLRERRLAAEVINLSVDGYNTQQEVEILRQRGLRFAPDLVLVAYTLSDRERLDGNIFETLLDAYYGGAERGWRGDLPAWLAPSALARFVAYRVLPPRRISDYGKRMKIEAALARTSGDTVEQSFARLNRLAGREGFAVLVAIFPYFPRTYEGYAYRPEHELAARRARRQGFAVVDLLPAMERCRAAVGSLRVESFHPNARGHRCAAEALAEPVLELAGRDATARARRGR